MLKQHWRLVRNFLFLFVGVGLLIAYTYSPVQTKTWSRLPQGKQNRALDIELFSSNELKEKEFTTILAKVHVYSVRGSTLSFSWALPEGVEVVKGESSGVFLNVQANQKVSTELTVRNFESKTVPRTISIQVFEELGGVKYGGTSALSNKPVPKDRSFVQKTSQPMDFKIHQ